MPHESAISLAPGIVKKGIVDSCIAGQMVLARRRISNLNICLYVFALIMPGCPGENVRQLHGCVVQSSSLRKMPLYSTDGD